MYVKATDQFMKLKLYPYELNFIPEEGYVFEVSEKRFITLSGDNPHGVCFVTKCEIIQPKKNTHKGKEENKIGIIIPNRNYGEHLERCFNSILSQTYQNFEIVFIDDCSTDDSVKIAKKILKKPHKVIELKQRRFNGGARNEGYLHLSKDVDYVWYVDSDDYLPDDKVLEDINEQLKAAPDVLFVGLKTKQNSSETETIPKYKNRYDAIAGWSGSCGKVIRKELATSQRCLFNEGTLKEDRNQHYRICIFMNDFLCLDRAVYVWDRNNYRSTTRKRDYQWKASTIRQWADVCELYEEVKGKDGIIDRILESRMNLTKREIEIGGDRQL